MLWMSLATLLQAYLIFGFPSFRTHLPNGNRVSCPPDAEGCSAGDRAKGEPASVCFGVGHNTCRGGTFPLNSFGIAFKEASHTWTKALCEADSDGDGLTNGEELGDPCCLWQQWDTPSEFTKNFVATHPGVANSATDVSAYVRPSCEQTLPIFKTPTLNKFNDWEEQRVIDLNFDSYLIPAQRTTYVDIGFNFPDDSHDLFHVVFADAIVKTKNLHHYVIHGCSEKFPAELHGKPLPRKRGFGQGMSSGPCTVMFGGWTPGSKVIDAPSFGAVAIGRAAGIVAFKVNVHFDNPEEKAGIVSQDGIRIWYTPTLRNETIKDFATMVLSFSLELFIPSGKKRFFVTRSCELKVTDAGNPDPEVHLFGMTYHAHLLGREMYTEVRRQNGTPFDLGSEPVWHFDDQYLRNLLPWNMSLKTGDHIQTTCVFDSTTRSGPTRIAQETTDEMCWGSFKIWPGSTAIECTGAMWSGELEEGENAFGIAEHHPSSCADKTWDMSNLGTGGRMTSRTVPSECSSQNIVSTSTAEPPTTSGLPDGSASVSSAQKAMRFLSIFIVLFDALSSQLP